MIRTTAPGWTALSLCLAAPMAAAQQGVSGYATIANDHYSYGLSQLHTGASLRIGADYQHPSGFFAGGTLSNVETERDRLRGVPRDRQVDAYAGFAWDVPKWTVVTTFSRYWFPNDGVDYNYSRFNIGLEYGRHLFAGVQITDELLGVYGAAANYEIGGRFALRGESELSLSIGSFESSDLSDADYTHWNIGVSKLVRRFGVDLRYYGNSRESLHAAGNADGDSIVLSLSVALTRRD